MSASEQSRITGLTVKYVRGFPIPLHRLFNPEYTEQAMDYNPRDGDIILVAYPRTGSTWQLYTTWNIIHKCQKSLKDLSELEILETSGKDAIDAIPEPRFYKYHLPVDQIRINKKAKYIYVYRNPADVLVSYYHFMKGAEDIEYDFNSFFEVFLAGKLPYANYFDHVLDSYRHKGDDNFLFLEYEKAKKDPLGEVIRIAKFLGEDYYKPFVEDSGLAEKIAKLTSFDTMKKSVTFSDASAKDESPKKLDHFFRKGVAGEGKAVLSDEQKKRLNDYIKLKMTGTELCDKWLLK